MNTLDQLKAMIAENEGKLNVKDALREGVSKEAIDAWIKEGALHKLSPGFYLTPEAALDEMFLIRVYSNDAVYSHETALFLHKLWDTKLAKWVVTAPAGSSAIHLRAMGVTVHFMKKDLFKLGMIPVKTVFGRTVFTYNLERTICDILRSQNDMSSAVVDEAVKRYAAREDKDLAQLVSYAKQFRIEAQLKKYAHLFVG